MPRLVLPGGTDVAEMAVFSVDALPRRSDRATLGRLEDQGSLIRFGTGADGAYLLHAYVEEPIPVDLLKYCNVADRRTARLSAPDGRIAFGGSESAYGEFKSNPAIRTDAQIPPGNYDVVAYHTDYPDELMESAVRARIGAPAQRLLNRPRYIIGAGVVLTVAFLFVDRWYAAGVAATTVVANVVFFKHPKIKQLESEKRTVELEYPSIVLSMTSSAVPQDSPNPQSR